MTGGYKHLCSKKPANAMRFKCDSLKHRANARVIQNATPLTVHLVYSFRHVVVVASAAPLTAKKFHGSFRGFPHAAPKTAKFA